MENKFSIKKLPNSEIEIKVTVAWEDWKNQIDLAVENLSKNVKMDGFRPGKAPRSYVEKAVGTKAILEEASEKAIQKTYAELLKKEKINAIGAPKAELLKLAEGNELEYKIKVAVLPEVQMKPWKEKIKKINENYKNKKIEISQEEIDKEMKRLAESRAKLAPVEREAKIGDNVMVDFQVFRDHVVVENGTSKNHPLILGKNVFIPGFEDNLVGMKAGEEKEFALKFPKEYHEKSLAGNLAQFKVKVNLVQERQLPEVNDEFAKSLGKFENLEALMKNFREGMLEEKKAKNQEDMRNEFLEELLKLVEVDLPEILVHEELHKMIHEFEGQVQSMGMTSEDYLQKMGKTVDDLEKEWEPQAEKRVKIFLILDEIAKQAEVQVANEKIEEEMNKTLNYYKQVKDGEKNIDMARLYNYVKETLTHQEVFNVLEKL